MKKVIRLTESDLHKIVRKSVKRILKEDYDFNADYEDGGSRYDREAAHYDDEAEYSEKLRKENEHQTKVILDAYNHLYKVGEELAHIRDKSGAIASVRKALYAMDEGLENDEIPHKSPNEIYAYYD